MNRRDQSDLVALRLPKDLRKSLPKDNVSAFIKQAIEEKLKRDGKYFVCPKCRGTGKVKL